MRLQDLLPVWLRNPATWAFHGLVVFLGGVVGAQLVATTGLQLLPIATTIIVWVVYIGRELLENWERIEDGILDDESKLDALGDAIIGPLIGFLFVLVVFI